MKDSDLVICRRQDCSACGQRAEKIWQEQSFTAYRCPQYGLIFCRPSKQPQFEAAYFRGMSQSEDAEYRIRHFRALIDALPISLQMPLLDIGAGLGYFLQALPSDIANSVTLVEPSQFAHKWLVDQAPGRVFSSIDQLPIDQCFKSVTLWDVLAHIPHPLKTLKAVRKHMDAEGYLIIKTPYHPQRLFWLARLLAPIGRGHSLVHVPSMQFHFTPDSLTSLLQTAGFQKVESYWTTESKRPSSHWKQRMLTATKKLAIQKLSFVVICKPAQLS